MPDYEAELREMVSGKKPGHVPPARAKYCVQELAKMYGLKTPNPPINAGKIRTLLKKCEGVSKKFVDMTKVKTGAPDVVAQSAPVATTQEVQHPRKEYDPMAARRIESAALWRARMNECRWHSEGTWRQTEIACRCGREHSEIEILSRGYIDRRCPVTFWARMAMLGHLPATHESMERFLKTSTGEWEPVTQGE